MTHKSLFFFVAAVGFACLAIARSGASLAAQPPDFQPFVTVWSGVYAKADAERGKQTSAQLCGRCHGGDLKGGSTAPGLIGSKFFDRWHDLKLGELVSYIQAAMPREHEFFVSAQSTREIVSLMLQESGIPPGRQPISSDLKRLDQILITRPAPAK